MTASPNYGKMREPIIQISQDRFGENLGDNLIYGAVRAAR
jgi:hypothetical protein